MEQSASAANTTILGTTAEQAQFRKYLERISDIVNGQNMNKPFNSVAITQMV